MNVILVDYNNKEIGVSEKIEAHKYGFLHKAFSIFVLNDQNELLLQKRQITKYHCGGLWTNTCCSHQRPNCIEYNTVMQQLDFEMGIQCSVKRIFDFYYYVSFENGLIEHEYDTIYLGYFNDKPNINRNEVSDYKWLDLNLIKQDIALYPNDYTYWFKSIFLPFLDFVNILKK
ncbi:MAG: isopentenyl-diphosphate Delta-isomerase [Bacteroidales bacterium]|jgi:isopentenyl-diphosphate delta-isomerase|nr:isopentenyl-diphosphate Delta-isomerase [Bacteroidales bacterium]